MNANYLAILLWVGSLIAQFLAYMWLAQKQRGNDDQQVKDMVDKHGKLEGRVLYLETQVANIRGWLHGSFGKIINGGDR